MDCGGAHFHRSICDAHQLNGRLSEATRYSVGVYVPVNGALLCEARRQFQFVILIYTPCLDFYEYSLFGGERTSRLPRRVSDWQRRGASRSSATQGAVAWEWCKSHHAVVSPARCTREDRATQQQGPSPRITMANGPFQYPGM